MEARRATESDELTEQLVALRKSINARTTELENFYMDNDVGTRLVVAVARRGQRRKGVCGRDCCRGVSG